MRELRTAMAEGNERAQLAFDIFVYRIKKYIGAYTAALGGVDILMFTGGIGENVSDVREQVCASLGYMGVKLDAEKNNEIHGEEAVISAPDSKVTVMVVPTDEEFMIASDTMGIVSK
jgi:acetate kinase